MMCPRLAVLVATLIGCGGGGGFPDAPPEVDASPGGTFSLDWSLAKLGGGAITCDQVGGVTVTALVRNRAVQGASTEVFSCDTGTGTSLPVMPGILDINFELTGVSGVVSTAPAQLGVVVSPNQDTPLQPVTFEVNAVGGLDLRVDALKTAGNCDPVAGMGAGITSMTLTLNHVAGGACEPATIMIGATPYTINCGTPMTTACIEKTTAITAASLPSDAYLIHVRANQAALTCFKNDDSIRVPPNAMTLTRTLNLGGTGTAGCL